MDANQVTDGAASPATSSEAILERLSALMPELQEETAPPQEAIAEGEAAAPPEENQVDAEDEAEVEGSQDDEADEADPEFETVQIGDDSYDVPPAVAKAVMRHSEYVKKVATVEFREHEADQLIKANQYRAQALSNIEPLIADIRNISLSIERGERDTDWASLRANDPIEYSTRQIDLTQAKQYLAGLVAQRQQIEGQMADSEAKHLTEITAEGAKVLSKKIPNWGADVQRKLVDYAIELGFSKSQLAGVVNPANVILLHKAYLYDQSRKTANTKVNLEGKRLPPTASVVRPGSTPGKVNVSAMKRYSEDRARLKRTGSIDDAMRLISL